MIESSNSKPPKKNSWSVKLEGEYFDNNLRKIPVEDSLIKILQSNSKWLLLQTNVTRDTVHVVRRNTKHKKDEHKKIEKKGNLKKK